MKTKEYECDVTNKRCVKDKMFIPFHVKQITIDKNDIVTVGKDVLCPDNVTSCKEHQTCCNFTGGQYGCCIFENVSRTLCQFLGKLLKY
jgi:hypothetical protein